MSVELNHTIIWCSDKARSADFLTGILGLPPARFRRNWSHNRPLFSRRSGLDKTLLQFILISVN